MADMTKMVNEKAFHDVVWSAQHTTPHYPDTLYRGVCVAKGDIKLSYLTRLGQTASSTEGAAAAASAVE